MKSIVKFLEYILAAFGYDNISDVSNSMFNGVIKTYTVLFCSVTAAAATIMEQWVGLEGKVYAALVVLFLLEFGTGVAASLLIRKERFNSIKLGRIVIKIFVYTGILILFNAFKDHLGVDVLNISFNFFEWIYYIILNLLILQLLVSVFENLSDLGWKEVNVFVSIFKKKIDSVENENDIKDGEEPSK